MATSELSYLDSAGHLKARIDAAEKRLTAALEDLPPEHPVALAVNDLLSAQQEARVLMRSVYEHGESKNPEFSTEREAQAAIQIEREHHTLKPEFKDILKALFLWRDDPAKVTRDKGEIHSDVKNAPL